MNEIMETRQITSEMNFLTRSDGSAILTQGKRGLFLIQERLIN